MLSDCNIGNNIGRCLGHIDYNSLQSFVIRDDPINNHGIKQLLTLEFNNLSEITIANTNITTDCMKIFSKSMLKLYRFEIYEQKHFENFQLIKVSTTLCIKNRPYCILIQYGRSKDR